MISGEGEGLSFVKKNIYLLGHTYYKKKKKTVYKKMFVAPEEKKSLLGREEKWGNPPPFPDIRWSATKTMPKYKLFTDHNATSKKISRGLKIFWNILFIYFGVVHYLLLINKLSVQLFKMAKYLFFFFFRKWGEGLMDMICVYLNTYMDGWMVGWMDE